MVSAVLASMTCSIRSKPAILLTGRQIGSRLSSPGENGPPCIQDCSLTGFRIPIIYQGFDEILDPIHILTKKQGRYLSRLGEISTKSHPRTNKMTHDEIIKFYGNSWCPSSRRARKILEAKGVEFEWINIDEDPDGREFVMEVNNGNRSVPTIVFPDGSILVEPSRSELLSKIES